MNVLATFSRRSLLQAPSEQDEAEAGRTLDSVQTAVVEQAVEEQQEEQDAVVEEEVVEVVAAVTWAVEAEPNRILWPVSAPFAEPRSREPSTAERRLVLWDYA